MTGRVTLLVEPEPDESLRSFVLRLAERNGISSGDMCEWLALPIAQKAPEELPTAMPDQVRVGRDTLVRMGLDGADLVSMLGHEIPHILMFPTLVRVCPACLAEQAYHRHVWQLRHFENCPRHRRPLISRCSDPDCGMKLNWRRWSLRQCACGHDLTLDDGIRTADCTIEELVLGVLGDPSYACDIPPFDGMSLSDTLDLLLFFGRLEFGLDRPDRKALARIHLTRDRRVLDAGLAIARDWPRSFERVALSVRDARQGKSSLSQQYGPLHRFIERQADKPYTASLREAYRSHLISRGDVLAEDFPAFLAPPDGGSKLWFKRAEIENLIKDLPQQKLKLMRSQLRRELKPVSGVGFGRPLYRARDVLAIKERLDRSMYARDVKKLLGLRRQDFKALVEGGVFRPIEARREGVLLLGSIEGPEIIAFQGELRRLAAAPKPRDPVGGRELATVLERKRLGGAFEVWKAIQEGDLQAHLPDPGTPTFVSISFEQESAEAWIASLTDAVREEWLMLADAAKILKVPQSMLPELIRFGHLPQPVQRRAALLLPRDAVEDLRARVVLTAELAGERGVGNRTVAWLLARDRIRPIVPDYRRVWGVPLYWRADIEAWEATREAA